MEHGNAALSQAQQDAMDTGRHKDWRQMLAEVVELGKRMRAVQAEYFRTRNLHTMRSAMKLETEFDRLLEETEKKLDGR